MKKILPIFSFLFHPIFIPIFGTLFYIVYDNNYFTKLQYLLLLSQVFIITVLLPIAFFFLLKTFGKVENIMVSEISQRKIPLLIQIILLFILINKSITVDQFESLHYFLAGGLLSSFLAFALLFINIKASIHMIGISALTIFIFGLSIINEINLINTLAFFVLMNGVVASSRLSMKAHTGKELIIGFICGVIPQTMLLYYWL